MAAGIRGEAVWLGGGAVAARDEAAGLLRPAAAAAGMAVGVRGGEGGRLRRPGRRGG